MPSELPSQTQTPSASPSVPPCHIPFSKTLILRNPHSPEPLFSRTTILRNPHSPKLPFSEISISPELPFSYFSETLIFLFLRIPYFSENTYSPKLPFSYFSETLILLFSEIPISPKTPILRKHLFSETLILLFSEIPILRKHLFLRNSHSPRFLFSISPYSHSLYFDHHFLVTMVALLATSVRSPIISFYPFIDLDFFFLVLI